MLLKTKISTLWSSLQKFDLILFEFRTNSGGEGGIFHTRQDRPWGTPSLLYDGYWVTFPGEKRPEHGVDRPPLSSAEVKERVELYLYSPSGPSWPVLGWTLPLLFKFPAFKAKYYFITIKDEDAGDEEQSLVKMVHKVQVVTDVTLNYTTFEAFTCPRVVYNEHS